MKNLTKLIGLGLFICLLTPNIYAQQNQSSFFQCYDADLNGITIDNTAGGVGFTASKYRPSGVAYVANLVTIYVECASSSPCDIRYFDDGVNTVTTTRGSILHEGDRANVFKIENITAFRAIRTGANSATLRTQYCR